MEQDHRSSHQFSKLKEWKKVFETDLSTVSLDLISVINTPAVIFLSGDLGAGKTTFSKILVDNFLQAQFSKNDGIDVTSPTYSLIHELGPVVHADLYRIDEPEELIHLELELYLDQKELFLVEWGSKFFDQVYTQIPEGWSIYELEITSDSSSQDSIKTFRNYQLLTFLM